MRTGLRFCRFQQCTFVQGAPAAAPGSADGGPPLLRAVEQQVLARGLQREVLAHALDMQAVQRHGGDSAGPRCFDGAVVVRTTF